MADAFGSLEQRLTDLADTRTIQALSDRVDEYRVRSRSEVAQVAERLERLESDSARMLELLRAVGTSVDQLEVPQPAAAPVVDPAAPVDLGPLVDAVRGLRDDIALAIGELRVELQAAIGDRPAPSVPATPVSDERFAAIETAISALRDDLAIERLESSMRSLSEDTSGLRTDVRRSFERVLLSIENAEQAVVGEVRAIDHRLGGMADDLRLVRSMRDGLEALASGVDAVRQLSARSATSSQMVDLTRDLTQVLAEIEAARAQVLAVDQHVGRAQAGAIDVTASGDPVPDVRRAVEELEKTLSGEIGDLGRRIEELATRAGPPVAAEQEEDPLVRRLRSLATSARQLGLGISEDIRARRAKPGRPLRATRKR